MASSRHVMPTMMFGWTVKKQNTLKTRETAWSENCSSPPSIARLIWRIRPTSASTAVSAKAARAAFR